MAAPELSFPSNQLNMRYFAVMSSEVASAVLATADDDNAPQNSSATKKSKKILMSGAPKLVPLATQNPVGSLLILLGPQAPSANGSTPKAPAASDPTINSIETSLTTLLTDVLSSSSPSTDPKISADLNALLTNVMGSFTSGVNLPPQLSQDVKELIQQFGTALQDASASTDPTNDPKVKADLAQLQKILGQLLTDLPSDSSQAGVNNFTGLLSGSATDLTKLLVGIPSDSNNPPVPPIKSLFAPQNTSTLTKLLVGMPGDSNDSPVPPIKRLFAPQNTSTTSGTTPVSGSGSTSGTGSTDPIDPITGLDLENGKNAVAFMAFVLLASILTAENDGKNNTSSTNMSSTFIQVAAALLVKAQQDLKNYLDALYAEQHQSGLAKIFSYVAAALLVVVGTLIDQPELVVAGVFMLIMQASGGQDALNQQLAKLPLGLKTVLEVVIALAEAACFCGVGAGVDMLTADAVTDGTAAAVNSATAATTTASAATDGAAAGVESAAAATTAATVTATTTASTTATTAASAATDGAASAGTDGASSGVSDSSSSADDAGAAGTATDTGASTVTSDSTQTGTQVAEDGYKMAFKKLLQMTTMQLMNGNFWSDLMKIFGANDKDAAIAGAVLGAVASFGAGLAKTTGSTAGALTKALTKTLTETGYSVAKNTLTLTTAVIKVLADYHTIMAAKAEENQAGAIQSSGENQAMQDIYDYFTNLVSTDISGMQQSATQRSKIDQAIAGRMDDIFVTPWQTN